ncbi:hypothetical protein C3E87_05955 [Tessaracoccus sp. ZS01]|nr:hypothetical protein [Tessaracoccus sp. ZS01]
MSPAYPAPDPAPAQAPAAPAKLPGDAYDELKKQAEEARERRITQKDRELAAAEAIQAGEANPLMTGAAVAMVPGAAPHYFSHPNYANSPLPTVGTLPGAQSTVGNELLDREFASDYPVAPGELAPVFVALQQPLSDGFLTGFLSRNQATTGGSPFASAGNVFHAYVLRPTGTANEYTVVFDSGQLVVPPLTTAGVSEDVSYGVANFPVVAGDRIAFYGQGIPLDSTGGTDSMQYPAATAPLQDSTITLGSEAFPTFPAARTYSFAASEVTADQTVVTGGIRKFLDQLPTVGDGVPAAVADTTTYAGSDYYEIALVEFQQQLHADLPASTLRGYVQLDTAVIPGDGIPLTTIAGAPITLPNGSQAVGVTAPSYLGPAIVANKDKPVRILFRNLLPTGAAGNLMIPTDTTVMGSGMTPDGHTAMGPDPVQADPLNPMCSGTDKNMMVEADHCYAENRATLHLHGGVTPWISDGTPHQWITPAGETTAYPQGVSVENVPDMPDPGPGAQTFFYTNAQSARLMFYHDHAWGITRLNVYAGEVAPYIITDDTEAALVNGGIIPDAASTLELVVQDKTFVPDDAQLMEQDETWDTARWGGEGSLWMPHVYSPAQNPGDLSGVNAYGRWAYGPWFWPPTKDVKYGPTDNPYYDATCDPDLTGWCEPRLMPGVPYLSMGMESFMDTPVVNGKAYPTVTLDPKAYRLRILNGANDRFFNLSLYKAVDADGVPCDASNPTPKPESTQVACTEVALDPQLMADALLDPAGVFPTPVVGNEGPSWTVIGTEGGFLPAPVTVDPQPITWVSDPTVFNAGNVDKHSLLVAPAERFDTIVDLSAYAGQTLILYNDAPAAFPARDPRYDYYTGNADLRDSGGAPSTLPGYGPNTRTVMQIKVAGTPQAAFDRAALDAAFKHTADGTGVFEKGQKPIIVGQSAYNSAYGTTFTGGTNGTVQIFDTSVTFDRLVDDDSVSNPGAPFRTSTATEKLTVNLKPKMIQDEMGEAFEQEYGRMSGMLGVETPDAQAGLQNMILLPYTFPPTEVLDGVELPPGMEASPITQTDDGTQIWKFTHNGVDTHPIHFHLYDVQLLNRVGWDGIIRKPHPTELGWKDTVRVSPLEDTIVALRPIIPPLPQGWAGLPNSIRLLDPSMPEGASLADSTAKEAAGLPITAFAPSGEPIDVVNHFVNFGWEYVLHCHILSHEEMDMMRTQVVGVSPIAPTFVSAVRTGNGRSQSYTVNWLDNSKNETAFVIERRVAGSTEPWVTVATVRTEVLGTLDYVEGTGAATGPASYSDPIGNTKQLFEYQVYAVNTVGDVWDYSNPAFNQIPPGGGFPTLTLDSRGGAEATLAAPTGLTGTSTVKNKKTASVNLTWTDTTTTEAGFLIQRADNFTFTTGVVNATAGANTTSFSQPVTPAKTYYYRVLAFNNTIQSPWSNTATVVVP